MNTHIDTHTQPRSTSAGFTLVETMIGMLVGSIILAAVCALTLFGAKTFAAMSNYVDLDTKSRHGLDLMTREIRDAFQVVSAATNSTFKSLVITNADEQSTTTYSWSSTNLMLLSTKVYGDPTKPTEIKTNLTSCDSWNFNLYQRTPTVTATNIVYFPATNVSGVMTPSLCKLIDMSWKCSRQMFAKKANTEIVQSAQIVLRNKQ